MRYWDAENLVGGGKWFEGFLETISMFALHGGFFDSGLDFKFADDQRDFMVNGQQLAPDEFGNFITGFSAGYADTPGLIDGVYAGGAFWAAMPGGEPFGDAESRPAIDAGYEYGLISREN
jgi:hypothetical protein